MGLTIATPYISPDAFTANTSIQTTRHANSPIPK